MLLPTFNQAKNSRIVQVASACNTSDEFRSLVNTGTDLLMQRGDWPGTIIPLRVMVRSGCIVWPRYVQRVRRINQCHVPIKVGTIWYDFVDREDYVGWCGANFYAWEGGGAAYRGLGQTMHQSTMVSQGRVPTYNDVPGDTPRYFRAYCQDPSDVGKTITVFGTDQNNQIIRSQDSAGNFSNGIKLVLAIPFVQTPFYVTRVDAVIKDYTNSIVPCYSYDPISNTQLDLAMYEPGETNPSYAKDHLRSGRMRDLLGNTCNNPFTVIALVKLAHIPVWADTDYITIPSLQALAFAIQAVKYGEAGDAGKFTEFMSLAVAELNHVLENELPFYDTPVDPGFMGGVQIGMQQLV